MANNMGSWGEWKFSLRELWLFNAFAMLETTFIKLQLIKISIACVHI